jgi:Icc protein
MSEVNQSRRDFLAFTGKAGTATLVATAAGINLGVVDIVRAESKKVDPFRFAIISDAHLYSMDNHKFDQQLIDAVAKVNAMNPKPDFVLFGGDVAQNGTEDQLVKGSEILSKLEVPMKIIPGEHDWYLDMGAAWRGLFGDENWSFDHKGVHFVGLNSILVEDFWTGAGLSDLERMTVMEMLESPIPGPWGVHERQLEWLKKDVAGLAPSTPIVVFTHSPLWDYYPRWNFQTSDAPEIREILSKFDNVMSYHGHVHQTLYNKIGNMSSVAAMSTSWPWPYPPVALAYPESRMNRADPSIATDGQGVQMIDLTDEADGIVQYAPFEDSLTDFMRDGFTVRDGTPV